MEKETLLIDIQQLAEAAKQDFDNKHWANYKSYIEDFNRLLHKAKGLYDNIDMESITVVPEGQQAWMGAGFSNEEKAKLREIVNAAERLLRRLRNHREISKQPILGKSSDYIIEMICKRIHLLIKQIRLRHDKRSTLDVKDEYDLQDLLHSFLRIFFDDIRVEEYTPSYAGKSSRMDFLLKDKLTVIETKMTRQGLGEREIGSQLIEDIARYQCHPSCDKLICLVYDPEGKIRNPIGLENDLSRHEGKLLVTVIIAPKGI